MTKKIISTILTMAMILSLIPALTVGAASTISVGQYVQMGSYYGEPILWRCVDIDENGPLMLADKILCFKDFDAAGTHKYLDGTPQADLGGYRTSLGSNLWETSNMRSWLNSTATAGNVTWLDGCPPTADKLWAGYNAYATEKGFLADGNFTTSERNAIKSVTQKSLLNDIDAAKLKVGGTATHIFSHDLSTVVQNYDTAYYQNVTDEMFLLDVKQINKVYQNSSTLGFDYYASKPTQKAVDNSEYKYSGMDTSNYLYYWLRSPLCYYGYIDDLVRLVNPSNGWVGAVHTPNSSGLMGSIIIPGVRPAFYMNLSSAIFKSGNGGVGSPYVVAGGAGNYVPVTSISLPSITNMNVGDYITLTPTISPSNGSMQGLKWSSYNPNIAVVSNGIVDGLCPGSTLITATTTDGSNISASCVVTVNSGANYSDTGTDALRKLALSNFVYNNLDSPISGPNRFVKYFYNIGSTNEMFKVNGQSIKWIDLYKQTIYNHRVLASSGDNGFSTYIQNMLSKSPNESGFDANTYNYTTGSSRANELYRDNGFYAAAFKDETGNIVIAYRGTEDFSILSPGPDTQQGARYTIGGQITSQFLSAILFYNYIVDLYKNTYSTNKIEVTGHSLGGALADYVSMVCNASSLSFNGATGYILKNTYLEQSNFIKAYKGYEFDNWGFKRYINSDGFISDTFNMNVAQYKQEYTNDFLISGNGYSNSISHYSHFLQSILHYDYNGFGISTATYSYAKNPWKMDNLYLGTGGNDTLTVEPGFLNIKDSSTLYTGIGNDTVNGGDQNDTIYAVGNGTKVLYGGSGDDTYILDADQMDSTVTIADSSGNDKILLKINLNTTPIYKTSDGTFDYIHLGGNKVIKISKIRDLFSSGIKLFNNGWQPISITNYSGFNANMLSNGLLKSDVSSYTLKNVNLSGVISVGVYDTNNQLLGTYSNTETKVETANWGYFYSTNDSTGRYMKIELINGNYTLKVTSIGSVDYSVYDLGASIGSTVAFEQKGIDLSDDSELVINSDFSTAINKFSLNNSGNVTPLTAISYTNAQQINLSSTDISLAAGTSAKVSATILPNNAVTKSVNWTIIQPTNAPPIAGVVTNADGSATVVGISAGTATLCATATDESGVNAQIPITVTQADAPIVSATADGAGYASDTFTSANIVTLTATLPVGFDKVYINLGGNTYEQTSVDITDEGGTDVKVYAFNSTTGEKSKTADFIVKIDRIAPVISGVAVGAKYYIDKHINVSDEFISSVTVNGTAFTTDEMNSGKWISQQGTYSIKATDLSGKETDVSFTINPLPEINTMTKDDSSTLQGIRTEFEETKYTLPDDRKTTLEQSISVLESRMVILLNDGFDLLISNISSTGSQITVSVLNLTGTVANSGLLVLSAYNTDNKLIGIKMQQFVDGQEQYVFNLDISQAYRVKAFLCDGLSNIKPISSARTSFVADGAVITY